MKLFITQVEVMNLDKQHLQFKHEKEIQTIKDTLQIELEKQLKQKEIVKPNKEIAIVCNFNYLIIKNQNQMNIIKYNIILLKTLFLRLLIWNQNLNLKKIFVKNFMNVYLMLKLIYINIYYLISWF